MLIAELIPTKYHNVPIVIIAFFYSFRIRQERKSDPRYVQLLKVHVIVVNVQSYHLIMVQECVARIMNHFVFSIFGFYVWSMCAVCIDARMMMLCSLYSSNQVIQQSPEINRTSMNIYIPTKILFNYSPEL